MTVPTDATPPAVLSAGGARLQAFLHRVVWQTGQQDGPDGVGPQDHTHCSALVAAIGLGLDIYLLRPPDHSQELLANAQTAWLGGEEYPGPSAAEAGWTELGRSGDDGVLAGAVAAANAGKLVVGGYEQPPATDPVTGAPVDKPGHVVVVRPQLAAIPPATGPLVTMAGDRNWRSIHMGAAFSAHPGAWPDAIRLFVHDTDLEPEFTADAGVG